MRCYTERLSLSLSCSSWPHVPQVPPCDPTSTRSLSLQLGLPPRRQHSVLGSPVVLCLFGFDHPIIINIHRQTTIFFASDQLFFIVFSVCFDFIIIMIIVWPYDIGYMPSLPFFWVQYCLPKNWGCLTHKLNEIYLPAIDTLVTGLPPRQQHSLHQINSRSIFVHYRCYSLPVMWPSPVKQIVNQIADRLSFTSCTLGQSLS